MRQMFKSTKDYIKKTKKQMMNLPEEDAVPAKLFIVPTKELEPFLRVSNYGSWRKNQAYKYI